MTREEFILDYCQRGDMTRERYDNWFTALPCDCDYDGCHGWLSIRRGFEDVHFELYASERLLSGK